MTIELTCRGCRYELRGLRPDGVCPECGMPVASTLSARSFVAASMNAVKQHRRALHGLAWSVIVSVFIYGIVVAIAVHPAVEIALGLRPHATGSASAPLEETFSVFRSGIISATMIAPIALWIFATVSIVFATRRIATECICDRRVRLLSRGLVSIGGLIGIAAIAVAISEHDPEWHQTIPGVFRSREVGLALMVTAIAAAIGIKWFTTRHLIHSFERSHQWRHARRVRRFLMTVLLAVGIAAFIGFGLDVGQMKVATIVLAVVMLLSIGSDATVAARAVRRVIRLREVDTVTMAAYDPSTWRPYVSPPSANE